MSSVILTLNAGSSSIKFAIFDATSNLGWQATGKIEGLGARPKFSVQTRTPSEPAHWPILEQCDGHQEALAAVLAWLKRSQLGDEVVVVSHRVVHGGPTRTDPVVIDDTVMEELVNFEPLAPLHQPHNLAGVRGARLAFPSALQVACFDTAFHRSHPFVADTFALPRRFYDQGVRRYGFHGLSYEYISRRLFELEPTLARGRVIVAHLGNGASMCAMQDRRSVASTMGFSALDGLPMGTRCGQLDPGVVLYLISQMGMDADSVSELLYEHSGLRGLSGISHDVRVLERATDPSAADALSYFAERARREIGGLAACLGGLDGLVLTGGIGENAVGIRSAMLSNMEWMGIALDHQANQGGAQTISSPNSRVKVMVLMTDEEAYAG